MEMIDRRSPAVDSDGRSGGSEHMFGGSKYTIDEALLHGSPSPPRGVHEDVSVLGPQVDHRLTGFGGSEITDGDPDRVNAPTPHIPEMIYRKVTGLGGGGAGLRRRTAAGNVGDPIDYRVSQDERVDALNEFHRMKSISAQTLRFNWRTFMEEFATHTLNVIGGPFVTPLARCISGKTGAQITGFYPGKIRFEGEVYNEPTQNFINQNMFWLIMDVPLVVGAVLHLSGIFWPRGSADVIAEPSTGVDIIANGTSTPTKTMEPGQIATDVDMLAEIVVPFMLLLVRQIVIAVKYAYIPREHIRNDRLAGRNMKRWNNEIMAPWCFMPTISHVIQNIEEAGSRARVDSRHLKVEFVSKFSPQSWAMFNIPETDEAAKEWKASIANGRELTASEKNEQKSLVRKQTTTMTTASASSSTAVGGDGDTAVTIDGRSSAAMSANAAAGPPRGKFIELWYLIKFAAYHGVQQSKMIPAFIMPMAIFGGLIPCFYKIFVLGRPGFGETHLDKWISAGSFLSYLMQGSGAAWTFSICGAIIFNRVRCIQDAYLELLIPSTVPDARNIDPPLKIPSIETVPDLRPSAENVYAWNLGRHALRQVGLYYNLRVQAFLGLYLFTMAGGIIAFIVSSIVKVSQGEIVEISAGMISLGWVAIVLIGVLATIIRQGMRANRQNKLHKSVFSHYRTRLGFHVKQQARHLGSLARQAEEAGREDEKKRLVQARIVLLGNSKDLQTALKFVANELDAEHESEKLRICGFGVDSRMLEALFGLCSGLAVTLWQVFGR